MLHVNQAKYLEDYRVWLSFDNGISGEFDLFFIKQEHLVASRS